MTVNIVIFLTLFGSVMKHKAIYIYPMFMNFIVGVLMLAGPMRAEEQGANLTAISFMITNYGLGYIFFSFFMGKIVKDHKSKSQVLISSLAVGMTCILLGFVEQVYWVIVIYTLFPMWTSLFFNAFQSYMKHVQIANARPIAYSVSSYMTSLGIGFAFGSLVSGSIRQYFTWGNSFFVAGGLAFLVAVLVLFISPERTTAKVAAAPEVKRPPLKLAGWSGSFTGIIIISLFLTLFPKQSLQLGFTSFEKGTVIFIYNIVQAIFVNYLARHYQWLYDWKKAPLNGILALVTLVLFWSAKNILVMYVAAVVLGVFSVIYFFTAVLHSMSDIPNSVRNIAINEISVGSGFLLGPQFINLTFGMGDYRFAYLAAGIWVVFVIVFQFFYIRYRTLNYNG